MIRVILPLIAFLSAFATIVYADSEPPEGFFTNLDVRYAHCSKKNLDENKVLCFAHPDIHNAFVEFTGAYSPAPNPEKAWQYLQIHGLYRGQESYNTRVPYLKKLGVHNDGFYAMYKGAAEWGEIQRQKSAEELYTLAYTHDHAPNNPKMMYSFLRAYLFLAREKGHEQAKLELDDISDVSLRDFYKRIGKPYPKN